MRILALQQGSPEWARWRAEGVGSSDAPALLGLSRWKGPQEIWETKCGLRPLDGPEAPWFSRGLALEVEARERYRALSGWEVSPLCCAHEEHGFVRASLDGWAAEPAIPVEIKAPNPTDHRTALRGLVPRHYLPQCLHILLATGAGAMHYVSYHPEAFRKRAQLATVRVERDARLLDELLEIERAFWTSVVERRPPPAAKRMDLARFRGASPLRAAEPGGTAGGLYR